MAKSKVKSKNANKSDVWYKVLTIFIAVVLVIGLLVAVLQPTGVMDYISLHTRTALKSENYKVSNAQFMYMTYLIYNNYYSTIVNSYGSQYASYFGLDRSLPLSQQKYYGSDDISWLDACVTEATSTLSDVLSLCEAARAEGYKMTDEDKQSVENNIQSLKDYAKESNYSLSTAIAAMYGSKGITKGDIKGMLEMQTLASSYASYLSDGFTYTDDDYNKYYDENKLEYLKADYYSYTVKADYETNAKDDEKTEAISAAKAKADELLQKIEGGEDFVTVIFNYEKELAEAEKAAAEQSGDEERITNANKALEELTEESIKTKVLTTEHANADTEADKWIFADTPATDGASKLVSADESATIYQIVKSAYRDEYNTISIRELDLTLSSFTNEDAMKEKAEEMIAEFEKGDKTGESFDKLAEKFSTDTIKINSTGLVKDTAKSGSTHEELIEVDEWLFSADRNQGDYKYFVFADEGLSIYYFEGTGKPVWLKNVDADMRSDDLETKLKEFKETYPVTENEKAIAKIS
ncbi:MAG: hypothetical protein J5585_06425 [Clostridia bacterium]|nr:hypothetical protein [Clostridia bacterium]